MPCVWDLRFEHYVAALKRRGREGSVREEVRDVVIGFKEVEGAIATMWGIVEATRLNARLIGGVEEVKDLEVDVSF